MKKLSLVMILMLIVSLTACGNAVSNNAASDNVVSSNTASDNATLGNEVSSNDVTGDDATSADASSADATSDLADGQYSIEITMEGGSGKAYIESPAVLNVKDGKMEVVLVWSSKNYDYMIVNGEKYLNETPDSQSTFTIPVEDIDSPLNVIGDTTAMSTPHEIEYVLTFNLSK